MIDRYESMREILLDNGYVTRVIDDEYLEDGTRAVTMEILKNGNKTGLTVISSIGKNKQCKLFKDGKMVEAIAFNRFNDMTLQAMTIEIIFGNVEH